MEEFGQWRCLDSGKDQDVEKRTRDLKEEQVNKMGQMYESKFNVHVENANATQEVVE